MSLMRVSAPSARSKNGPGFILVAFTVSLGVLSPPAGGTAAATNPADAPPRVIQVGTRPESVTRGFAGSLFVTVMNDSKTLGDGVVKVIAGDLIRDFAGGFDEPKGICFTGRFLVTTDVKRVWRIDARGEKTVLAQENDFPHPVSYLNDTACEPGGKAVYVSDMGANTKMRDAAGNLWPIDSAEAKALPAIGRIYRIGLDGKISVAVESRPDMPCPNGVTTAGPGTLLMAEFFTGNILQARGPAMTVIAPGLRGADGIEQDRKGNVYVSSWTQGKVWRIQKPGTGKGNEQKTWMEPTVVAEGFQSAADFLLDEKAKVIVLPDMKAGTLTFLPLR